MKIKEKKLVKQNVKKKKISIQVNCAASIPVFSSTRAYITPRLLAVKESTVKKKNKPFVWIVNVKEIILKGWK
jgi:hypothetical protein